MRQAGPWAVFLGQPLPHGGGPGAFSFPWGGGDALGVVPPPSPVGSVMMSAAGTLPLLRSVVRTLCGGVAEQVTGIVAPEGFVGQRGVAHSARPGSLFLGTYTVPLTLSTIPFLVVQGPPMSRLDHRRLANLFGDTPTRFAEGISPLDAISVSTLPADSISVRSSSSGASSVCSSGAAVDLLSLASLSSPTPGPSLTPSSSAALYNAVRDWCLGCCLPGVSGGGLLPGSGPQGTPAGGATVSVARDTTGSRRGCDSRGVLLLRTGVEANPGPREDFQLRPSVLEDLLRDKGWPRPTVDAFASGHNALCPVFWDEATDALSMRWLCGSPIWANPPFYLLGAVVRHIRRFGAHALVLCPHWSGALGDLRALATDEAVLPPVPLFLRQGWDPMPTPPWDTSVFYVHHWPQGLRSLLGPERCVARSQRLSLLQCGDVEPNPGPRSGPSSGPPSAQERLLGELANAPGRDQWQVLWTAILSGPDGGEPRSPRGLLS